MTLTKKKRVFIKQGQKNLTWIFFCILISILGMLLVTLEPPIHHFQMKFGPLVLLPCSVLKVYFQFMLTFSFLDPVSTIWRNCLTDVIKWGILRWKHFVILEMEFKSNVKSSWAWRELRLRGRVIWCDYIARWQEGLRHQEDLPWDSVVSPATDNFIPYLWPQKLWGNKFLLIEAPG